MINAFFAALSLILATIHLVLSPKRRSTRALIVETYLLYFLFFYVGVMGVLTAYAHVFRPIQTSASIGWQPSPYEYEVGMADLTVGVLGILCVWIRGNFWLATAIANAVWLLGDAIGHIRELTLHNNHAENNSGLFLYAELITPLIILALAIYNWRARRQE